MDASPELPHAHGNDPGGHGKELSLKRGRWVFWAFVAMAALFLLSEHRAHVLGALPYLVILACPLLHRFMHRKHDMGHGEHLGDSRAGSAPDGPRRHRKE